MSGPYLLRRVVQLSAAGGDVMAKAERVSPIRVFALGFGANLRVLEAQSEMLGTLLEAIYLDHVVDRSLRFRPFLQSCPIESWW